jgi:hypothetical protein
MRRDSSPKKVGGGWGVTHLLSAVVTCDSWCSALVAAAIDGLRSKRHALDSQVHPLPTPIHPLCPGCVVVWGMFRAGELRFCTCPFCLNVRKRENQKREPETRIENREPPRGNFMYLLQRNENQKRETRIENLRVLRFLICFL